MAKFIQKNPLIVLLIFVFLAIVAGAAGYFLLIGPRKATIENKQKELEAVKQEIEAEKMTHEKLLETKDKAAEYESKLAKLDAIIPQAPELPQLIRNIQAAADPGTGAGIPWLSFTPSEVAGGEGASFSTYNFSMTVAGYYDEVTDLVYRIERFTRAVMIETISISSTTDIIGWGSVWGDYWEINENWGLVQAEISAKTFTYAPGEVGARTAAGTSAAQPQAAPSVQDSAQDKIQPQ